MEIRVMKGKLEMMKNLQATAHLKRMENMNDELQPKKKKNEDLYALEYKWNNQQYINQKMEMEMKIRKLEVMKHLQVATLPKEDINDELQNKN